jgi:hypothetical protein
MGSDRGVESGYGGRIMVGRVLVEALMRPVIVEMAHILVNDGAGVSLIVDQQPGGALLANAADKPFGIAVRPRCLGRNLDHIEAFGGGIVRLLAGKGFRGSLGSGWGGCGAVVRRLLGSVR